MLVKVYLYTIMIIALSVNFKNCNNTINKKITVIGIAEDDKDAATVLTDDGRYYILDGLDEWDEKYAGKKVKVSGKLVIEEHKKQSTDSFQVQERVGTWRIIKRPKWSLVE
jgi:hypothetical protein